MSRRSVFATVAVLFLAQWGWAVYSQTPRRPGALRHETVADRLFMISGEGGNVAVYVTDEGVVLVDDMFDRNHEDILAQVKSITDRPLRYVINTHQHDDHAGGDAKMLPIAEVIAHRNVRANLIAKRKPFFEDTPGTPIGLPRITFADEADVNLGGAEVRAIHFGRGHTNGDAVVYFPAVRAVHTGDLFLVQRAPAGAAANRPPGVPIFVDYSQGGSFHEWSATIDRMLTLDFDKVIPGHGPVSTRADVVKFRADLQTMHDRLVGLVKGGTSREALVQILERDYGWRSTGCPPAPPTPGCLQYQQVDAFIAELKGPP